MRDLRDRDNVLIEFGEEDSAIFYFMKSETYHGAVMMFARDIRDKKHSYPNKRRSPLVKTAKSEPHVRNDFCPSLISPIR